MAQIQIPTPRERGIVNLGDPQGFKLEQDIFPLRKIYFQRGSRDRGELLDKFSIDRRNNLNR